MDNHLLSLITFLPTIGALLILGIPTRDSGQAEKNIRYTALWVTLATFIVSLFIWFGFDPKNPGFQFVEEKTWLGGGINYRMGVDGISVLFVMLTTLLMPLCILAS